VNQLEIPKGVNIVVMGPVIILLLIVIVVFIGVATYYYMRGDLKVEFSPSKVEKMGRSMASPKRISEEAKKSQD